MRLDCGFLGIQEGLARGPGVESRGRQGGLGVESRGRAGVQGRTWRKVVGAERGGGNEQARERVMQACERLR